MAGAKQLPQKHNDGISLVPLFNGKTLHERALIWYFPHYGNQGGEPSSIIRRGDWKLIHYYEDGRKELYNLANDIGETRDLAAENQDKVEQLGKELFDYLTEVGAKYPIPDSEYSETVTQAYLYKVEHEKMPLLEKQRMNFLSKEFDPKNNWWGSMVTKD